MPTESDTAQQISAATPRPRGRTRDVLTMLPAIGAPEAELELVVILKNAGFYATAPFVPPFSGHCPRQDGEPITQIAATLEAERDRDDY